MLFTLWIPFSILTFYFLRCDEHSKRESVREWERRNIHGMETTYTHVFLFTHASRHRVVLFPFIKNFGWKNLSHTQIHHIACLSHSLSLLFLSASGAFRLFLPLSTQSISKHWRKKNRKRKVQECYFMYLFRPLCQSHAKNIICTRLFFCYLSWAMRWRTHEHIEYVVLYWRVYNIVHLIV